MAVPKRRTSKTKRAKRRASAWTLSAPELVKCSQCGAFKRPHRICPECGFYKGKKYLEVD